MRNLAPKIFRQRLLIDCLYKTEMHEKLIKRFLKELAKELNLRTYSKPVVHVATGRGKEINSGYDAFVPLISSGIYVGVWPKANFITMVIYTCKGFNTNKAVKFVKKFFNTSKLVYERF